MDYQKITDALVQELRKNKDNWQERFAGYADTISKHKSYINRVEKHIKCIFPLKLYLNLSENTSIEEEKDIPFQIRYKGNKIGCLVANKQKAIFHPNKKWNDEPIVKDLDAFYDLDGNDWSEEFQTNLLKVVDKDYSKYGEHQFESFLLDDFAQERYEDKILPYSTPVVWATKQGSCFQMPTTWKGSDFSKQVFTEKDLIRKIEDGSFWAAEGKGGGIDILLRRTLGSKVIISIMELKNPEHKYKPDRVILQALAYAVFIRELIRTDSSNLWWKMFINGGQTPVEKKLNIEAVVTLSTDQGVPPFAGTKVKIGDDEISLEYLFLKKDNYSWKKQNTSMRFRNKAKTRR